MNEPLGYAIGNTLEVIEAVEFLQGKMPEDVKQVVYELGSYMLKLAGKGENIAENKVKIEEAISSNRAYEKFIELVQKQGGDTSYIKDLSKFPKAKYKIEICSKDEGYIENMKAENIGKLASFLGAGRIKKEDEIDLTAGIILNKKVADYVQKGELLATLYTNDENKIDEAKDKFFEAVKISKEKVEKEKCILEVI